MQKITATLERNSSSRLTEWKLSKIDVVVVSFSEIVPLHQEVSLFANPDQGDVVRQDVFSRNEDFLDVCSPDLVDVKPSLAESDQILSLTQIYSVGF